MRILLIEDDSETARYVVSGMQENGHEIHHRMDGREGLFAAAGGGFDLLIVDRMLPEVDGVTIVRTLRAGKSDIPILFLTTMSGIGDRVEGLKAGADDYLVKPFAMNELAARVVALGRRRRGPFKETILKIADLEVDLLKREVRRAGRKIALQPREFMLLEFLMRHAGEVVTRTMLLENVWDYAFDPKTNIVESHLSRLRNKVDKGHSAELIVTVRGAGYCLRDPR